MATPECTGPHSFVKLLGRKGGEEVATGIHTCLACGMLKVGTNTIRISDVRLDMDDKELRKAVLKDYGEEVNALGNITGATTINLELGNVITATATGNVTFSFSNPPASGTDGGFILELYDGGSYTITWPSAVVWSGGVAPGLSVSQADTLIFSTDDAGTTWHGMKALKGMAQDGSATPIIERYGWIGGGETVSTVERFDFKNDLGTASVRGPLTVARYGLAATGNSSFGWFGGGFPAVMSTVDRIEFANDSPTASARGPLSVARFQLTATGNSSFGYFGGGSSPVVSTIDRIDYGNDTPAATAKGPLSAARYGLFATGNSSFGYFASGHAPAVPGYVTTVDRVTYSNDTPTATARGPVNNGRWRAGATGNSSFGWFAGGHAVPGPILSYVDRIEYANDTPTASSRTGLPLEVSECGTSGTSSFGYIAAGTKNTPGKVSSLQRITYSDDTSIEMRGAVTARAFLAGAIHQALS